MTKDTYIISFASGKGGVGKSFLVSNLGYLLSERDLKVLLIDFDLDFPNLHILNDIEPRVSFCEVFEKKLDINKGIIKIKNNLFLLSNSSELSYNNKFSLNNFKALMNYIDKSDYDYILIDLPSGVSDIVLKTSIISHNLFMVITDETTSIIDTYGLLKVLKPYIDMNKVRIILNNIIDSEDSEEIIKKFEAITHKLLNYKIHLYNTVFYDREIRKSIQNQYLYVKNINNSEIIAQLYSIVDLVLNHTKQGVTL